MPSVWILNHYAALPSEVGGTRHIELARRLVERGFEVTLISSAFRHATRTAVDTKGKRYRVDNVDGVQSIRLRAMSHYHSREGARILNMIEFALRAWRAGRSRFHGIAAEPDVVVGSSPHLLAALAAARLARKFDVPFIFEVRDLWPETFVALGRFSRKHPIVRILHHIERRMYRRATRIISLLPDAWRYIEGAGGAREMVTWIPNGASIPASAGEQTRRREREACTVMYVGAHGRANTLEDLVSAAGLVAKMEDGIRFVLVGDGPEKARLMQQAGTLGLQNLEFRAPLPKQRVPELLRTADVLVALLEDTPLYSYGVALNKLFDYMAAGRPVVFAGRVSHDYVAEAGCGLTIPPRNPSALATAIVQLARMPEEERKTMGERGRSYVREHHDWDLLADRLADALHEAVAASPMHKMMGRDDLDRMM